MKKSEHPSDEFFRKALQDHRMIPSADAKKAFLAEASRITGSRSRKRWWIAGSSFTVLLILGILGWNLLPDRNAAGPISGNPDVNPTPSVTAKTGDPASPATPADLGQPAHAAPTPGAPHPAVNEAPAGVSENTPAATGEQNRSTPPVSGTVPNRAITASQKNTVPLTPVPASEPAGAVVAEKISPADTLNMSNPARDTSVIPSPASQELQVSEKDDRPDTRAGKKHGFSLGIYYMPEWMFNTLDGAKFINNFGLEGAFSYGRFSIRTGAGLSIGSGANEFAVEYNEYLGVYNKLDSMEFKWNVATQDYDPTMYMSKSNVYDSLLKTDYPRIVKRYTYLQIPMIMGYDFLVREKFSLGFRVGPVLSVLVATRQLSADYDPGNNRMISINDISPGQVSLNWQAMGGIAASFQMSKMISVELEPSARYYFNSVYEKPAGNYKPWSVGLRAACIVKF